MFVWSSDAGRRAMPSGAPARAFAGAGGRRAAAAGDKPAGSLAEGAGGGSGGIVGVGEDIATWLPKMVSSSGRLLRPLPAGQLNEHRARDGMPQ